MAQDIEIYEYKNSHGVTVFTNNPDELTNRARISPAAIQIYSAPAVTNNVNKHNASVKLDDSGRQKILLQEYHDEQALLKEAKSKLIKLQQSNDADKVQLNSATNNILQHEDNISLLKAQLQ